MTLEEQLYQEAIKNGAGDSLIPRILPIIEADRDQAVQAFGEKVLKLDKAVFIRNEKTGEVEYAIPVSVITSLMKGSK